jgi:hypothetical protein
MGCDIHAYIEYRDPKTKEIPNTPKTWCCWGRRYYVWRNYMMFGLLAGVRGQAEPVVEPRGIPDGLSWEVMEDATLKIVEDGADLDDNEVHREQANKWLESRYSKPFTQGCWGGEYITDPDWHSFTWLTSEELLEALKRYETLNNDGYQSRPTMYYALLGTMKALEAEGFETRLVLWVDN